MIFIYYFTIYYFICINKKDSKKYKQGEYFYYHSYFWKSFWKSITRVFFSYLKLLIQYLIVFLMFRARMKIYESD